MYGMFHVCTHGGKCCIVVGTSGAGNGKTIFQRPPFLSSVLETGSAKALAQLGWFSAYKKMLNASGIVSVQTVAIRMTVVPIRILIRTTVLSIRNLIRTTVLISALS